MTDFGFGLIDRRTVLAVLFTLSISHLLLGNRIPVDTKDVISILLGIVILTGSVFILRTISRIVIAIIYFLLRVPFDVINSLRESKDDHFESPRSGASVRPILNRACSSIRYGVGNAFVEGFLVPLILERNWRLLVTRFDFGFRGRILNTIGKTSELDVGLGLIGIVDRIALVLIVFFLTLPIADSLLVLTGSAGIILLLIIFIITGKFTFVLTDPVQEKDEKPDHHLDITMQAEGTHM